MIDTNFDFRTDTPTGKDPDAHSRTLRTYHKLLWSKTLPCGQVFELDDSIRGHYLLDRSSIGEFSLTSDAITHSYKYVKRMQHIIGALPLDYVESLFSRGCTIGSYIVFPGKKIGGKMNINGARGCNAKIGDRFDLTLECIRRHYFGIESPLAEVLARYGDYFKLFESFQGYVEYFLLQDLVTEDFSAVKFYLPFTEFQTSPYPASVEDYMIYNEGTIAFINGRNDRIRQKASSSDSGLVEPIN
ncbi:hypothetical protein R0135_01250 [Congregibacter variabilis]|uniref:Uncharacterized protein n=1 Tax=Congregibacter variabilis TaxID=3081200 RepID=A0ABZ0I4S1_9GAMM|nr:hypothetical protein R0135_01250 [Congregibacter sp. IMCC43200]